MTVKPGFNPAIGLVILSTLLFAVMDAGSKHLSSILTVVLIIWVRFTIQAILMAFWVMFTRGPSGFRGVHLPFQFLRGGLLVGASVTAVAALRQIPLAEFTAIIMLMPIVVTAVSARLLNETVGLLRWILVLTGFVGCLLIIRPGSGLFGPAALLPLLAMLLLSAYHLLSGRMAGRNNPFTSQFYAGVTGSLLLLPLVVLQLDSMTSKLAQLSSASMLILLSIGLLGTIGHLLVILAYSRSGTASMMPYTYSQIGFAALVGWLMFSHVPDQWAWLGMAIIAICGICSALLNSRATIPASSTPTPADSKLESS